MSDDLDKLRAKVAAMRELGVIEADGIKLGAPVLPPKAEETKEEMLERMHRAEQRQHDILFAASATKPILRRAVKS